MSQNKPHYKIRLGAMMAMDRPFISRRPPCSTNSNHTTKILTTRLLNSTTHSQSKVSHPLRSVEYSHSISADVNHEQLASALQEIVHQSGEKEDVTETIHAETGKIASHPWMHKVIPGVHKWEASHHIGNYVAIRGTDETFFESMPIYAR
jgi:hypothetical protein